VRRFALPLCTAAAGIALVAVYLVLVGASYVPSAVANPCTPRPWTNPQDASQVAQQLVLSALDGAACDLHVSREELTLALRSQSALEQFTHDHGLGADSVAEALRGGALRAVDDAQRANALSTLRAFLLRTALETVPVDRLVQLLQSGSLSSLLG
jgi:hypothetical protein